MDDSRLDNLLREAQPSSVIDDSDVHSALDVVSARSTGSRAWWHRFRVPAVIGGVLILGAAGGAAGAATGGFEHLPWEHVTVDESYDVDGTAYDCYFEVSVVRNPGPSFVEADYEAAKAYLETIDWAHVEPDMSKIDPAEIAEGAKHGKTEAEFVAGAVTQEVWDDLTARGWVQSVSLQSYNQCSGGAAQ
jgi:hypothetical protein